MNKDVYADKLLELKTDIQRWLGIRTEDSNDVERAQRNAEELIWKLQERYGYVRVRQDREQ